MFKNSEKSLRIELKNSTEGPFSLYTFASIKIFCLARDFNPCIRSVVHLGDKSALIARPSGKYFSAIQLAEKY